MSATVLRKNVTLPLFISAKIKLIIIYCLFSLILFTFNYLYRVLQLIRKDAL